MQNIIIALSLLGPWAALLRWGGLPLAGMSALQWICLIAAPMIPASLFRAYCLEPALEKPGRLGSPSLLDWIIFAATPVFGFVLMMRA